MKSVKSQIDGLPSDTRDDTPPRCLAVIANEQSRADEVAAGFAQAGDVVVTRWFDSPESLLRDRSGQVFEAVIYYAPAEEPLESRTEAMLRSELGGVALFRVVS